MRPHGDWAGLAAMYAKYRDGRERTNVIAHDWKNAVALAAGGKTGHQSHTRARHQGGGAPLGPDLGHWAGGFQNASDPHAEIRRWFSAVLAAELRRWPGPHGITVRMVLRALGGAAQMSGSMLIEFGTRSLAMGAALDHSTVARVLRELCAEDDPYLVLLDSGQDRTSKRSRAQGDLYQLRIPDSGVMAAEWRRWRPGRIGPHPVWHVLGHPAALTLEQLSGAPVRGCDLPILTGMSASTVTKALAALGEHGLAVRGPGGWRRGPATLDEVAEQLGVPEILAALAARYREERRIWRGRLMIVIIPPAPPANDIPLPDAPAPGDDYDQAAASRGPPAGDAMALLEAGLGPLRVITAA
jgi:DNA-binding transcriptional ArsR family regulator